MNETPIRAKVPGLLAFGTEEKLAVWLKEQHGEKKRPADDIAKEVGCSPSRIIELLAKFGIEHDRPKRERPAAPPRGDARPFHTTPRFKEIVAVVEEVLCGSKYRFERNVVIDSAPAGDAVWTAPHMRAVLSPQRTESGARSRVCLLDFENADNGVKHQIKISSPAAEKVARGVDKFMKLIVKAGSKPKAHYKADDLKPAKPVSLDAMSFSACRDYDPLCFCERCRNMRRMSLMHTEDLCLACHCDDVIEKELPKKGDVHGGGKAV